MEKQETAIERAVEIINASQYVVALVGAGLSAESGIPTFRGAGGLWTRVGEPSVNGYERFLRDPVGWWKNQLDPDADPARAEFREAIDSAEPNAAHYALVKMERLGVLKMTITQNVDDLHARAGAARLVEIHGNRMKARCIVCESRWPRDAFDYETLPPACPGLRRTGEDGYGDVWGADTAVGAGRLFQGGRNVRLHDRVRHVRDGVSGCQLSESGQRKRRGDNRVEP